MNEHRTFRLLKIPKGNGKFRVIYAPSAAYKAELRGWLELLTAIRSSLPAQWVQHAFIPGRSHLSAAVEHIGFQYTLKFDLKNFFDTVTSDMVDGFTIEDVDLMFIDGAARQGLPTSPAVANIAASGVDYHILNLRGRKGRFEYDFVYTRYADDLTFSFNDTMTGRMLLHRVPEIVAQCGFEINESKTRFQSAKYGRRMIIGVGVDATGIHPSRKMKRRLRAARHQNHWQESVGLAEYMKLKLPKNYVRQTEPTKTIAQQVVSAIANAVGAVSGIVSTMKRKVSLHE